MSRILVTSRRGQYQLRGWCQPRVHSKSDLRQKAECWGNKATSILLLKWCIILMIFLSKKILFVSGSQWAVYSYRVQREKSQRRHGEEFLTRATRDNASMNHNKWATLEGLSLRGSHACANDNLWTFLIITGTWFCAKYKAFYPPKGLIKMWC